MRRHRKRANQFPVTLFPFLAVLICTLGVLIVMLVMAVHSAEVDGKQARLQEQEKHEQERLQLELALETRQIQIDVFEAARPDNRKRLNNLREQRSRVAAESRELTDRLEILQTQLDRTLPKLSTQHESVTNSDIEELTRQLRSAENDLGLARQRAEQIARKQVYWIIPSGPNGANRRPIYLECDEHGITIQPYGIQLKHRDFHKPVTVDNPLDQALATISQYWSNLDVDGAAGKAYPLLVVRPGGAQAYLLARHCMSSWHDEFGYELVDDKKQVEFGTADPQLTQELKAVVDESKQRQRELIANQVLNGPVRMTRRSGRYTGGSTNREQGLIASSSDGGFVNQNPGSPGQSGRFDNPDSKPEDSIRQKESLPTNSSNATRPSASQGQNSGRQFRPLAATRGQNWALPNYSPGATAYVRPIRIYCSNHQLELRSAASKPVRVQITGNSESTCDALVAQVWKTMDSWGLAGQNGYWKPTLKFTVMPGGESRFRELQATLQFSGLNLEMDPTNKESK